MKHEKYKNFLTLKYFDELKVSESKALSGHLKKCSACKNEEKKIIKTFNLAKENNLVAPTELLISAKRELNAKLFNNAKKENIGFIFSMQNYFITNYKYLVAASVIFVIGIFFGSYYFSNEFTTPQIFASNKIENLEYGKSFIKTVKHIEFNKKSGELELIYETATPTKMKSNLNDTKMQKLVEHSILREDNSGIRLRLLDIIYNHISSGNKISNSLSRSLAKVAMFDENAGARRMALENLIHLPYDNEIRNAVMHILTYDNNSGLKNNAINFFTTKNSQGESIDIETKIFLKDLIMKNDNGYVKMQAMNLLQEGK